MPRGYTSITFRGGSKDGEFIDDISIRNLPSTLSFRSEIYFAKGDDGDISIMKGELSSKWVSYNAEIYTKLENDKHKQGIIFQFLETREVTRCSAITKKKTQCLKPSLYNLTYCSETHKPMEIKQ
jgi:hypothetical protein